MLCSLKNIWRSKLSVKILKKSFGHFFPTKIGKILEFTILHHNLFFKGKGGLGGDLVVCDDNTITCF